MVSYCKCGHDAQIHTPGGGYLQPGTPRGEGGCTALRCWCVEYVNRQAQPHPGHNSSAHEYDVQGLAGSPAVTNDERNSGGVAP